MSHNHSRRAAAIRFAQGKATPADFIEAVLLVEESKQDAHEQRAIDALADSNNPLRAAQEIVDRFFSDPIASYEVPAPGAEEKTLPPDAVAPAPTPGGDEGSYMAARMAQDQRRTMGELETALRVLIGGVLRCYELGEFAEETARTLRKTILYPLVRRSSKSAVLELDQLLTKLQQAGRAAGTAAVINEAGRPGIESAIANGDGAQAVEAMRAFGSEYDNLIRKGLCQHLSRRSYIETNMRIWRSKHA